MKTKGIITDADDEDGGAEQVHIEKNKKKKWPSIPGVFVSLLLCIALILNVVSRQFR